MNAYELVEELHTVLVSRALELLDATGKSKADLAVPKEDVDAFFEGGWDIHLPSTIQIFQSLGCRLNLNLAGSRPFVGLEMIEVTGLKRYRVELTGLARMKTSVWILAKSEKEAVEEALMGAGDHSWKYEGMVDDTVEGEGYLT